MKEFLIEYYSLITKSFEALAAIIGLIYFNKYKHTPVKYFIYFLIYVLVVELIGGYTVYVAKFEFLKDYKEILKGTLFQRNFWWYSLFWNIGSVLFFSFYFRLIIKNKTYKRIINYSRNLFVIASIVYIAIVRQDFFLSFNPFINIITALAVVLCIVLYFVEVLKSDKIIEFYHSMNFYIAASMLFWYLAITPLTFYNVYFTTSDWNFVILKWQIYLFTNIFMYSCFSIGLICSKPQTD